MLPATYYALPDEVAAGLGPDVFTLQGETGEQPGRMNSSVVVRHVTSDRIVASVEIVSPGNKASRQAFQAFLDQACELLEHRIRLLIVETLAIGQPLPDMPLFLEPNGCVMVPLEATYQSAFAVMPRRWRTVLEKSLPTAPPQPLE